MKPKLFINLSAVKQNYLLLKEKVSPALCATVVKANAYGLGVEKIALTLLDAGCEMFFVATIDEGIELREILPNAKIAILNGIHKASDKFEKYKLIPILNNSEEIMHWSCEKPCILHIDTGMNRLGFSNSEIPSILSHNIIYIMSHLACADEHNHPKNKEQLEKLLKYKNIFPNIPLSLSASSGVFLGDEYHLDMVRIGIALYGCNPTPYAKNPMSPAIKLTAPIVAIRKLKIGESIGYGASFIADKDITIGIIPVGYADGLFRSLSNKAEVMIGGVKAKVLGRISMDLTAIDITNIPNITLGSEVDIINDIITIEEIAKQAGTIPYEILTNLGNRFERIYIYTKTGN